MSIFRRNKKVKKVMMTRGGLVPADRFDCVLELVKDLPATEFRRFMDGIELAWKGYDKALRVQTREEKETRPVGFVETEVN